MPARSNTQEFIRKANIRHNNQFDYSMVDYKNNSTKVVIICSKGHIFYQTPNSHLNGRKCTICQRKAITTEDFIERARKIHGQRYDYNRVVYKKANDEVEIICTKHGSFFQKPSVHLNKRGCYKCGQEIVMSKTKTQEQFIEDANRIHNSIYDYSNIIYKNCKSYLDIKCSKHGIFQQKATTHLTGRGCPTCNNSKGELDILNILQEKNIDYISQFPIRKSDKYSEKWKFIKNCKFDFYLPKYNTIIEYHGIQHYIFSPFFHGTIEGMNKRRKRDCNKREFCIQNNLEYFEIKYDEDISERLNYILQHIQIAGTP